MSPTLVPPPSRRCSAQSLRRAEASRRCVVRDAGPRGARVSMPSSTLSKRPVTSWCPRSSPKTLADVLRRHDPGHVGVAIARQTIDLYLSMSHEKASPVPVDDLVRGRIALSCQPRTGRGGHRHYAQRGVDDGLSGTPALMAGNSVILRPSPLTPISSLIGAAGGGGPTGGGAERGSSWASPVLSYSPATRPSTWCRSPVRAWPRAAKSLVRRHLLSSECLSNSVASRRKIICRTPYSVRQRACDGDRDDRQACVVPTRMLVPQEQKEQVLEAVSAAYKSIKVGPPSDPSAVMGPVICAAQRERCEQYVQLAEEPPRGAAAADAPQCWAAATSSSPQCWTCRTTPTRRPGTKSSARSSASRATETSTTRWRSRTIYCRCPDRYTGRTRPRR